MKINVAMYGGTKDVQMEVFSKLSSTIYFDIKRGYSHTITDIFIIDNTLYKVVAVVSAIIKDVVIHINNYHTKQELFNVEIETDVLRSVNI